MSERDRLDWDTSWISLRHVVQGNGQSVPSGTIPTTGEHEMNQRDAFIVKNMWNTGASVGDIAYVLGCSERTVRRCIDRNFEATEKKRKIADRQEKFFPGAGTGCYRAGVVKVSGVDQRSETMSREMQEQVDEPFEYTSAMQEIEARLQEEVDSLSVERLLHLTSGW